MATNVFGTPVTNGSTLERALNALNDENAGGKRDDALAYVRKRKEDWGTGVSTLAIFYNATGETLVFTQENSSFGHIDGSYPTRVQNGQWGAFLHVKTTAAAAGSVGYVVYRVKVDDTDFSNGLIAWSTPWNQASYNNEAYCDVFADGQLDPANVIYEKMDVVDSRQHVVIRDGIMITSKIEEGTSPVYEAEFTRASVAYTRKAAAAKK